MGGWTGRACYWLRPAPVPCTGSCFFFPAEDGIRAATVTGVQTCALPIFPAAQLEAAVKTLANKIAEGPSLAIHAVKRALFASGEKELARALENEVQEQVRCFLSEDCNEGIRAFFEKRPPKFHGK